MMGKLKEAQKKVEETKERLNSVLIDETSNDNKLKITLTANRTIKSITIDDDLLVYKEQLEDYLILTLNKAIEKATKNDPESVSDFMVENVVVLNLQRSCQACIDIAQLVISLKSLGLPNSYKMSFQILAKERIITKATADKMGNMAGFRNIAVHDYQEISHDILKSILNNHLGDFKEFYDEVIKIF
jgi:uncharacterized protein YutE (UPF0331/DUF86 family)